MARFASDVEIAVVLVERLDMDDRPRLTEGVSHSQPYMIDRDLDELHQVQAWLATRAGDTPSLVQAAVANFRRVLDDVLLVYVRLQRRSAALGGPWLVRCRMH
jgi:hypothetical protein